VGRGSRNENAAPVDLAELLLLVGEVTRSLWAAADARLRTEHGLSLPAVRAMAIVAERGDGCDAATVASDLSLGTEEARTLIDDLVAARRLTRGRRCAGSGPDGLGLTLPGRAELARAQRALEDELARRLGAPLSADELARLEGSLATMLASVRAAA